MASGPGSRAIRSASNTWNTRPIPRWCQRRTPSLVAMPALSWPRCCSAYNPRCAIGAAGPSPLTIPMTPHSSCKTSLSRRRATARRRDSDVLHEEGGVIGIVSGDGPAAPMAHLGLDSLPPRGQGSAGIATSDGVRLWHHRGMGLVFQVFDADRIARLPGPLAIGHVRYSTMGSVRLENAQPLVVPSPWGPLALAHNGNLINAPQLRAELEAGGGEFSGTTDSEVIAHLIARTPAPEPEDAVAPGMRRTQSGHTIVGLVAGRGLGWRDAHAIPPFAVRNTR